MVTTLRKLVFAALVAALLPLVLPSVASAQLREFSGRIDKVNSKGLIVDNRMGDKIRFSKTPGTVVEGEKTEYKQLKKKDWVVVHWKMIDKPRKAYKIIVTPPKEDADEE